MKNTIKGLVKILVAGLLIRMTIGWFVGGGIGTYNAISEYGVSSASIIGSGVGLVVVIGIGILMIVAIKKLISSGIRNFRS